MDHLRRALLAARVLSGEFGEHIGGVAVARVGEAAQFFRVAAVGSAYAMKAVADEIHEPNEVATAIADKLLAGENDDNCQLTA
ncbi:hypothetical protein EDD30_1206 [Couchioplanes caeruleus]|uniref:Uncharacterized protein n=3 Tax=Couchioplanes caeruleus TaxID=56438 RepID=A0A1K0FSU6_9ACTN|nr:hypothetical protein BG844_02105 [Couchioplanes caeruleus subsp. caeruleus]ROP28443.1 hypothetical protein EDD30_1206 [Couchioplanes caeruleus]